MRETRLGLENFHNLINNTQGNTMIWAPRQSGKTFALVRKFVETRNSVFFVPMASIRRTIDNYLVQLGCPNRRRDVYVMHEPIMGRRIDSIFIDEIDCYRGNLVDALCSLAPCLPPEGRIIAVSTPVRPRENVPYEFFTNEYTLGHSGVVTTWREIETKPKLRDYFEKDSEVFTI